MISRRAFLQGSVAMGGLALAGTSIPGFAAPATLSQYKAPLSLFSAIYDNGFPASAAFGAATEEQGYSTHDIDGDITELWVHHLAEQWQREPVAIAGLTHASALFVLERMGWDHGLRVIFRARHQFQANGDIEHRLSGPASMLNAFKTTVSEHASLGACMAGVLSHCHGPEQVLATLSLMARSGLEPNARRDDVPLVSWVIAPRSSSLPACNGFDTVERIV
ncbi:hypothetical protein ebA302 [Aromatoleum aromaticum EbN1]|uniref:Twin-arginine translocation signal domain-containing protein n=1 Tax=Aromatoleum aromaticum (strain DSM 19018 / LMG 30748 / EbN1) TaxID=76114 RepID=Q5P8T1_AROAE|nr:twin-arginine translocation signal domain-containing protein [Aromatoleum aromaticum]CAI06278.1 hypothetical protein ebA302 [Aromatoleum aromaticum EbN1]